MIGKILTAVAKPFLARKVEDFLDGDEKPHAAQPSTQIGKVGGAVSITMLTQVNTAEETTACIAVLLASLFFTYKPDNFMAKIFQKK